MSYPATYPKFKATVPGTSTPAVGYKLYTYAAGTSTPQNTYTDSTLGTPNTNPVELNAYGEADVWLSGKSYKFILKTPAGATVWTIDNILDLSSALGSSESGAGDALIAVKSDLTGSALRTQHDKNADTVSVRDFGALGNGSTEDTDAFQAAFDALTEGGTLYVPAGEYPITGVTTSKTISIVGDGPAASKLIAATAGSPLISWDQTDMLDQDRRNWLTVEGISASDVGAGTSTGLYFNGVLCVVVRNCHFREFTAGLGVHVKDGLWIYLENNCTDRSEVRCISETTPHYNNQVFIRGGEYRNPSTHALYIKNCDVLHISNLTMEGDYAGTLTPDYGLYLENVQAAKIQLIYSEFIRDTGAILRAVGMRAFEIDCSYMGSSAFDVPELWLTDCVEGFIHNAQFNWHPLVIDGESTGIILQHCRFAAGAIDIAEGCGVRFIECGPASITGTDQPCIIPIDPQFQGETFSGEGYPFKNWYESSSFDNRDPTDDCSGTCTTAYDTTVGYHDTNSLKATFSGTTQESLIFSNLGTTDADNSGAVISFMAKASVKTNVLMQPSIYTTLGTAYGVITTEWKRYFLFSKLGARPAGTGINLIMFCSEASDIWIDDVQTVSYATYDEALAAIAYFRHVPTHGTRITAKESKNLETHKKYFDRGFNLRSTTILPTGLVAGDFHYADGTTWNPSGSGVGPVFYDGAKWLTIPGQLGGSAAWTPGSVGAGATVASSEITVTGAAVGDKVDAGMSATIGGMIIFGEVTATNKVKAYIYNQTTGAISVAAGTVKVRVTKM